MERTALINKLLCCIVAVLEGDIENNRDINQSATRHSSNGNLESESASLGKKKTKNHDIMIHKEVQTCLH